MGLPLLWRMMSLHMESMLSNPRCSSSEPHELHFCLVSHTLGLHKTKSFLPSKPSLCSSTHSVKNVSSSNSDFLAVPSLSTSSIIGTSQAATEDCHFAQLFLSEKGSWSQRLMDKPRYSRPQGRGDVGSGLRRIRSSKSESSNGGFGPGRNRVYMSQQQDLKRRLIISVFHRLFKEKIQRNTILTMQYIDNATLVPAELKDERKNCYTWKRR